MTGVQLTGRFERQLEELDRILKPRPEVDLFLPKGPDARALYDLAMQTIRENELWFKEENNQVVGCNVFAAAKINTLVKPLGLRVVNLRDLSRPEVGVLAGDTTYVHAPELIVRAKKNKYPADQKYLDQAIALAERKEGRVEFPFKLSGFDVSRRGRDYVLTATDDLEVVQDDRLYGGSRTEERYTEVDELGIPKFESNGSRTWYIGEDSLTWVMLSKRNLSLGYPFIKQSNGHGGVILVRDKPKQDKQ